MNEQRAHAELVERARRLRTSPKMTAILGYLLGVCFTRPALEEVLVTSDGWAMARHEGEIGHNYILGKYEDLERNVKGAAEAMDLTPSQLGVLLRALEVRVCPAGRQYVS